MEKKKGQKKQEEKHHLDRSRKKYGLEIDILRVLLCPEVIPNCNSVLNSFTYIISTAICPAGWQLGPDRTKCFFYFGNSLSWNESETTCRNLSAHLATINSFNELNFTRYLCKGTYGSCWVGGRLTNSTSGLTWKWSDNSSYWNNSFFPQASLQSSCNALSCQHNSSINSCTLVTNGSLTLAVEGCNRSHPFICMVESGMQFLYIPNLHFFALLEKKKAIVFFICDR